VGRWNANGTLSIVDRRKNILKLAQGEYVAPERIENVYSRCPLVAQVFVDGQSTQTCLVAVVVPDKAAITHHFGHHHNNNNNNNNEGDVKFEDTEKFWKSHSAERLVLEAMLETGRQGGLNTLEQVKAVTLCPEAFTLENELLTPTMKSRRPMLRKRFGADIERMYKTLSMIQK